jgi:hypothetical protein
LNHLKNGNTQLLAHSSDISRSDNGRGTTAKNQFRIRRAPAILFSIWLERLSLELLACGTTAKS